MTDFEIFVECLWKFFQPRDPRRGDGYLWETFISDIQNFECEDFRWYYYMAVHYNNIEENVLALIAIERSIELLAKVDYHCKMPSSENSDNVFYGNNRIREINSQNLRGDIYYLAGEISAKNDEKGKSLMYYQTAHYYKNLLTTEYKNKCNIGLYTYRAIKPYAIADIVNNEITVTSPRKMNDPFDSIFTLWSDNLDKICTEKKHVPILEESFRSFRIRSFTTKYDDVLMWSHYADDHKGICIKYRLSRHFINQNKTDNNEHMYLKNVCYTREKVCLDKCEIDTNLAFVTKKTDWKYEKEVRLISYNPNVKGDYYSIKLDQDSFIDRIYFGYRCDDSMIKMIRNLFQGVKNQPKFYKMELDTSNVYRLKAIKI